MAGRKDVSVWSGMAAGLAAGLAGSLARALVSRALGGGAENGAAEAASALSRALLQRDLSGQEKDLAPAALHLGVDGAIGALYGAGTALVPAAGAGAGLPFGAAAWLGVHVYGAPRLGLSDSPLDRPIAGEAAQLVSYLVYGAVTEAVRRALLPAPEE